MGVNYSKLWIMLIQKNITKPQFRSLVKLSPATFTKLNKNQTVSLEIIVRICQTLQCNIGDIMDIELRKE